MKTIHIENPNDFFEKRKIPHAERNTILSTNHITHFTPKFETLLRIIEGGFRPSFCTESPIFLQEYHELKSIGDFLGMESPNIESVDIPMVCFCDIPLKLSKYHRKIYGLYGISLHKDWAISNWISPVFYVVKDTKNHAILYSIQNQFEKFKKNFIDSGHKVEAYPNLCQLDNRLSNLWNFIKPYNDSKTNRKYYDEREWRYFPPNFKQEEMNNPETYLKFNSTDIYQIIVKNANERRLVNNLLKEKYGKESKKIIKIKNI